MGPRLVLELTINTRQHPWCSPESQHRGKQVAFARHVYNNGDPRGQAERGTGREVNWLASSRDDQRVPAGLC